MHFFLHEATFPARMLEGIFLELALAGFVADRAIEWMVDEQKFHHRVLCGDRFLAHRINNHSIGYRCRTRDLKLRHPLHDRVPFCITLESTIGAFFV